MQITPTIIYSLEQQFLQFKDPTVQAAQHRRPLPCAIPIHRGIDVFFPRPIKQILIVDDTGQTIDTITISPTRHINLFGDDQAAVFTQTEQDINNEQTFFIGIIDEDNHFLFSQPLIRVPQTGYTHVKYKCNEDAFGFPFTSIDILFNPDNPHYASFNLPISLSPPQFIQETKTYTTHSGKIITLYAKYYKEYSCHTDYLTEEYHQKIITALSSDTLLFNDKLVTKSENYQINWDKHTTDCYSGSKKIAQATFKVRENIYQKNTNYNNSINLLQ